MNDYIEISHLGRISRVSNQDEMLKAFGMGESEQQKIVMHDEDGQLVGIG